ncbi:MAG: OpgC domain-containing protein, partial [Bradyrhizobium sp.]
HESPWIMRIPLVVLAFFVTRFLPREWPGYEWPVFQPIIKCGQQSLEVFCTGVFLAVIAHVVLVEVSGSLWMQIVVSFIGIVLMTLLAYYRSWSKKVDKAPPKTAAAQAPMAAKPAE